MCFEIHHTQHVVPTVMTIGASNSSPHQTAPTHHQQFHGRDMNDRCIMIPYTSEVAIP